MTEHYNAKKVKTLVRELITLRQANAQKAKAGKVTRREVDRANDRIDTTVQSLVRNYGRIAYDAIDWRHQQRYMASLEEHDRSRAK